MPCANVLITRGITDGGWSKDITDALKKIDPTTNITVCQIHEPSETMPLNGCARIPPEVDPSPLLDLSNEEIFQVPVNLSFTDFENLKGILTGQVSLPNYLRDLCAAIEPYFFAKQYTHLIIPPTGPGMLPMAMHDYPRCLTRRSEKIIKYQNINNEKTILQRFGQVNMILSPKSYPHYHPLLKFASSNFARTLIIEIALIIVACRLRLPIYGTCHGAQLLWILLNGRLRKIPELNIAGFKNDNVSINIQYGMLKLKSRAPINGMVNCYTTRNYYDNRQAECIGLTNQNSYEYNEGISSKKQHANLDDDIYPLSSNEMCSLMKKISHFEFNHSSYMLYDENSQNHRRIFPHPIRWHSCFIKQNFSRLDYFNQDIENIVGSFQVENLYAFQHHPHRVIDGDKNAYLFFKKWLDLRSDRATTLKFHQLLHWL